MVFSISDYIQSNTILVFLFVFLTILLVLWIILRLFRKNNSEEVQNSQIDLQEKKIIELKTQVSFKPVAKDFNLKQDVLPELKPEADQKEKLVSFNDNKFQQVAWPRYAPQNAIKLEEKQEIKEEPKQEIEQPKSFEPSVEMKSKVQEIIKLPRVKPTKTKPKVKVKAKSKAVKKTVKRKKTNVK